MYLETNSKYAPTNAHGRRVQQKLWRANAAAQPFYDAQREGAEDAQREMLRYQWQSPQWMSNLLMPLAKAPPPAPPPPSWLRRLFFGKK